MGEHPLFSVEIQSGQARKIVGDGSVSAFDMVGKTELIKPTLEVVYDAA